MTESKLPPLPPPTIVYKNYDGIPLKAFTPAQMCEYGQLCRQQALEQAEKHLQVFSDSRGEINRPNIFDAIRLIRSLK